MIEQDGGRAVPASGAADSAPPPLAAQDAATASAVPGSVRKLTVRELATLLHLMRSRAERIQPAPHLQALQSMPGATLTPVALAAHIATLC